MPPRRSNRYLQGAYTLGRQDHTVIGMDDVEASRAPGPIRRSFARRGRSGRGASPQVGIGVEERLLHNQGSAVIARNLGIVQLLGVEVSREIGRASCRERGWSVGDGVG